MAGSAAVPRGCHQLMAAPKVTGGDKVRRRRGGRIIQVLSALAPMEFLESEIQWNMQENRENPPFLESRRTINFEG